MKRRSLKLNPTERSEMKKIRRLIGDKKEFNPGMKIFTRLAKISFENEV